MCVCVCVCVCGAYSLSHAGMLNSHLLKHKVDVSEQHNCFQCRNLKLKTAVK